MNYLPYLKIMHLIITGNLCLDFPRMLVVCIKWKNLVVCMLKRRNGTSIIRFTWNRKIMKEIMQGGKG